MSYPLSSSLRRSRSYPALPSFAATRAVLIFLSCSCVSGGKRSILHTNTTIDTKVKLVKRGIDTKVIPYGVDQQD